MTGVICFGLGFIAGATALMVVAVIMGGDE